jgi:hypothetical protein
MPCRRDPMDNRCFDDASATQAALKHPAWDHLIDTSPEGWMEFYKSLCRNAMLFSIALVPFESFNMSYRKKGHGLCLCGLGICRYRSMGRALFAVLQTLMPQEDMYIKSQVESVANDSCNVFELLWILQKKLITMFDLTKEPTWSDWHDDIFRYTKRILMHCNLSHHRNTAYSDANHSLHFLRGLQGCWKALGVLYILMVLTHQQVYSLSVPLPQHLLILPLAQTLAKLNQGGIVDDMTTTQQAFLRMYSGHYPTLP